MTGKHLLSQIVRGLDGVTAGPWHTGCLGSDSKCQCSYVLSESYMGAICTVHVGNGLPIGEGGNDAPPAEEAAANMRHIARCSPDAMREIAAYVRDLEERLAKVREEAIEDVLGALTAHELYQYRPKAFTGFIEYARTNLSQTRSEK